MKIFVLTHNYSNAECGMQNAEFENNAECRNALPNYALCTMHYALPWMLLPDSALLAPHTGQGGKDKPLYLPDFDPDIRLFPSIAIRISRLGKDIAPRFAHRYYHEWAACLCARGMQTLRTLAEYGLPWGSACSFDGSFVVGEWQEVKTGQNAESGIQNLRCEFKAEEQSIVWDSAALLHGADELIARISADNILKTGDIIVLGTPVDWSFKAEIGMTVTAEVEDCKALYLRIK